MTVYTVFRSMCSLFWILILILLANVFTGISQMASASTECGLCPETPQQLINTYCQEKGQELHTAKNTNSSAIVCQKLHEMFVCIGKYIPQCLVTATEQYRSFKFTPWDCKLTNDKIQTYQELINNTECVKTSKIKGTTKRESENVDSSSCVADSNIYSIVWAILFQQYFHRVVHIPQNLLDYL